jgi:hypothetical protein
MRDLDSQKKPLLISACFLILAALDPTIEAGEFESLAPYFDDREATARGKELGIGSAILVGPSEVEALTYQALTVEYKAGDRGIAPGGGVHIGLRHVHGWTRPQNTDPKAPGYLTVDIPSGASQSIVIGGKQWFTRYFPWQHIVAISLPEGLGAGETVRVTYGDTSGGSPGIRVQPFDEFPFTFRVFVDPLGNDDYLPLESNPSLNVIACDPYRLNLVMPTNAVAGEPTWVIARAEDRYGNPATTYRGTVRIESTDEKAALPSAYAFQEGDRGVHRFEEVVFRQAGAQRLTLSDGAMSATGNPVLVAETRPEKLLLWGDLHGHTLFSDGRGTVEQFYDFAENVAGLDFCAVTDHDYQIVDWMWEHSKKVTNSVYKPGRFVTFQAYEWSGQSEVGGDHNVFFLEDDPPLVRCRSYYDYRNHQLYHGDLPQLNHVEDLFVKLAYIQENENIFCIPHYGGRPGNPSFHNPRVQRMIEVFSEHQRSETWMTPFLLNGHRLGILASTDGHYGNPGYGYLKEVKDWDTQEIGMASVAVYAEELTRESVFRALYNRRVYATSGDRIILDVTADGRPMGSEIETDRAPTLSIKATGTAPIAVVQIKKNSESVQSFKPNAAEFETTWTDPDFDPKKETYYYVRLIQEDNEEAISSPIWVN